VLIYTDSDGRKVLGVGLNVLWTVADTERMLRKQ